MACEDTLINQIQKSKLKVRLINSSKKAKQSPLITPRAKLKPGNSSASQEKALTNKYGLEKGDSGQPSGHMQSPSIKLFLQKDHKRSNSMVATKNSISSQSMRKRQSAVGGEKDGLQSAEVQLLAHNKFQILTKLQILLKSEKRENQLDFKKISQQVCLLADKGLISKPFATIAYILIRNKLARLDDIQNWIKLCCQGKESGKEKLTIESKIGDEQKFNVYRSVKTKYLDSSN